MGSYLRKVGAHLKSFFCCCLSQSSSKNQFRAFFKPDNLRWTVQASVCAFLTSMLVVVPQIDKLFSGAGYWAVVSAVVVLESTTGASLKKSAERIFGTVVGGFGGWSLYALITSNESRTGENFVRYVLWLVVTLWPLPWGITRAKFPDNPLISVYGTMTGHIVLISAFFKGGAFRLAVLRTFSVVIGVLVAAVVCHCVMPNSARMILKKGLSDVVETLADILEPLLELECGIQSNKTKNDLKPRYATLKQIAAKRRQLSNLRKERRLTKKEEKELKIVTELSDVSKMFQIIDQASILEKQPSVCLKNVTTTTASSTKASAVNLVRDWSMSVIPTSNQNQYTNPYQNNPNNNNNNNPSKSNVEGYYIGSGVSSSSGGISGISGTSSSAINVTGIGPTGPIGIKQQQQQRGSGCGDSQSSLNSRMNSFDLTRRENSDRLKAALSTSNLSLTSGVIIDKKYSATTDSQSSQAIVTNNNNTHTLERDLTFSDIPLPPLPRHRFESVSNPALKAEIPSSQKSEDLYDIPDTPMFGRQSYYSNRRDGSPDDSSNSRPTRPPSLSASVSYTDTGAIANYVRDYALGGTTDSKSRMSFLRPASPSIDSTSLKTIPTTTNDNNTSGVGIKHDTSVVNKINYCIGSDPSNISQFSVYFKEQEAELEGLRIKTMTAATAELKQTLASDEKQRKERWELTLGKVQKCYSILEGQELLIIAAKNEIFCRGEVLFPHRKYTEMLTHIRQLFYHVASLFFSLDLQIARITKVRKNSIISPLHHDRDGFSLPAVQNIFRELMEDEDDDRDPIIQKKIFAGIIIGLMQAESFDPLIASILRYIQEALRTVSQCILDDTPPSIASSLISSASDGIDQLHDMLQQRRQNFAQVFQKAAEADYSKKWTPLPPRERVSNDVNISDMSNSTNNSNPIKPTDNVLPQSSSSSSKITCHLPWEDLMGIDPDTFHSMSKSEHEAFWTCYWQGRDRLSVTGNTLNMLKEQLRMVCYCLEEIEEEDVRPSKTVNPIESTHGL